MVETCLFPWSEDTLPTAEDVISLYGFNPEMQSDPLVDDQAGDGENGDGDDSDEEEESERSVRWKSLSTSYDVDVEKAHSFFNWMKKIFSPLIQIAIGCESMNPVPCFILAQIAPGWVGGVLTSLALT